MTKKFNWGWGILYFWILLVITVAGVIVYTQSIPEELVEKNYYEKGLNYQNQIDKMKNYEGLKFKPVISDSNGLFSISFPKIFIFNKIKGSILFYKPSDKYKDIYQPLSLDSTGKINIPLDKFAQGFWKAKIDWSYLGILYYFEYEFNISNN